MGAESEYTFPNLSHEKSFIFFSLGTEEALLNTITLLIEYGQVLEVNYKDYLNFLLIY